MKRILICLFALVSVAQGTWATDYISDVILIGSGKSAGSKKQEYVNKGWIDTNYNLNKGCGSDATNIYLLYKTSTNKADAITGFYIQCGSATRSATQVSGGHTYYPVEGVYDSNFVKNGCNLNNNAGGNKIYLFYTKEHFDDDRAITTLWFDNIKVGAVGSNGDESSGCDLNSGAGGSYIYMHILYEMPTSYEYEYHEWDFTNNKDITKYKTCDNFIRLGSNGSSNHTVLTDGWYVVDYDIELQEYLDIDGDVNILLVNGKTMYAKDGIRIKTNSKLTIYGQYGCTGKIKADGSIGGKGDINAGDLIVHSGTIECKAKSHNNAAIGAGNGANNKNTGYKSITIYGGIVTAKGVGGGAGIGGGQENDHLKAGPITIYGGTVNAKGGSNAAGIGGGEESGNGLITIYGGSVTAEGGSLGAGIGCGEASHLCHPIYIYGGNVTARGGENGAGIGNGEGSTNKETTNEVNVIYINGGKVIANGGKEGAGIGGGSFAPGAKVEINGGSVYATGGVNGAGIGSGAFPGSTHEGNGGILTVNGGYIEATSKSILAAPIGGGWHDRGGKVTINGGTVKACMNAEDYLDPRQSARYIGGGDINLGIGELYLGDLLQVRESGGYMPEAAKRIETCQAVIPVVFCSLTIKPCNHPGATFTDNGDGTHTINCRYCNGETVPHNSYEYTPDGYVCKRCNAGVSSTTNLCSIGKYTYNASQNAYVAVAYQVPKNVEQTLPECDDFEGYEFAGWVVASDLPTGDNCEPLSGETLLQPGEKIMVTGTIKIVARYRPISITLADNASNESLLRDNYARTRTVTLADRTLWKDNSWNTLCLPFSLTAEELAESQLSGYTGLKELDVKGYYDEAGNHYFYHEKFDEEDAMETGYYDDKATPYDGEASSLRQTGFDTNTSTLYLYFRDATSIEAGMPYIVKWATAEPNNLEAVEGDLQSLMFSGVTINNVVPMGISSSDGMVTFTGTYAPVEIGMGGDNTMLYLGSDNNLYYPNAAMTIGCQRAFFQLNGIMAGAPANSINNFVLNFGDDTTGIVDAIVDADLKSASQESGISNPHQQGWYTLDGRRMSSKPTLKGFYINNGKKVIIK